MGCIFIAELSTPFVSLGKILMQVGEEGRGSGLGSPQQLAPPPRPRLPFSISPCSHRAGLGGSQRRGSPTAVTPHYPTELPSSW